jgi:hypothetical protein
MTGPLVPRPGRSTGPAVPLAQAAGIVVPAAAAMAVGMAGPTACAPRAMAWPPGRASARPPGGYYPHHLRHGGPEKWIPALAGRGYQGTGIGILVPVKSPPDNQELDAGTHTRNALLRDLCCTARRLRSRSCRRRRR